MLDVHTHSPSREGETVIQQDVNSVGIHPCDIDDKLYELGYGGEYRYVIMDGDVLKPSYLERLFDTIVDKLEHNDNHLIKAIGECGIDKLSTCPLTTQIQVFEQHVHLSEQYRLPLIIHCVRAMDELLEVRRRLSPTQPWIWHGFRGKPQQLQQLLRAGLYISFGFKYNKESLLACPPDRMFLETDTNPRSVQELYDEISSFKEVSFCK